MVRIATFNLLNKFAPNAKHYAPWDARHPEIAAWAQREKIQMLATQEGLPDMVADLSRELPRYRVFGRPRSDNPENGEYCAVYADTAHFTGKSHGTFWLSERPEQEASVGWDAALPRICTWVHLVNHETNHSFYVFNIHFDHVGVNARKHSSRLILRKIEELTHGEPAVLLGDFNSPPSSRPMHELHAPMKDAREEAESPPRGPEHTHCEGSRLDYILLDPRVRCREFAVERPKGKDGNDLSDHFPLVANLVLP